jgi:glutaminyl-peptide cyclotransferase
MKPHKSRFARLGLLGSIAVVIVLSRWGLLSRESNRPDAGVYSGAESGATSGLTPGPGPETRASAPAVQSAIVAFNGQRAFDDLKRLVDFGPRPPGSKALSESRRWIIGQLKEAGWEVEEDQFTGDTPLGRIPMTNLIARIPGASPSVVVLAGHYDTLRLEGGRFVGANDGGSSAAFLLEMARLLGRRKNPVTYWLVFFDGEEALRSWSPTDKLYGSRHLVSKLAASGELNRMKAMILVDMIGDAQLDVFRDQSSTAWLREMVLNSARRLGLMKYFQGTETEMDDDHIPFVNAGVSAVDLIDYDYGPNNSYWHTPKDTLDKCSPASLAIVGRVVSATLEDLESSARMK